LRRRNSLAARSWRGIKTDETLGKTGTGPEGLPHSIIVTAEGVDEEGTPPTDVSHSVAPTIDVFDGIGVEEKPVPLKPRRKQPAKARSTEKGAGKAATVPSLSKKSASVPQHTGAASRSQKAHLTRKKK
jgi:DNA topoisomerase VI subunit B